MRKVIVAAFATEAQTDEAVTDLKAAGIASTAIRRYVGSGAATPSAETLRSEQEPMVPSAEAGRTVLAVTIEHPESSSAMQVLARHRPISVRDTGHAPEAAVGENIATPANREHPADAGLMEPQRQAK